MQEACLPSKMSDKNPTTNEVRDVQHDVFHEPKDTGYAVVEQVHVIPSTGERMPTSVWEYRNYCLYAWGSTGVGIG